MEIITESMFGSSLTPKNNEFESKLKIRVALYSGLKVKKNNIIYYLAKDTTTSKYIAVCRDLELDSKGVVAGVRRFGLPEDLVDKVYKHYTSDRAIEGNIHYIYCQLLNGVK